MGLADKSVVHINFSFSNIPIMFFYLSGRPLAWLICLMHMIEIIFHDLFFAIDGKPSGPETYTGPIGKKSS